MKQVLIRKGKAIVEEVPSPTVGSRHILVQTSFSCISAGTERSTVSLSAMPLYQRALKQPHHVKRVLSMVREQGFKVTKAKVQSRLSFGTPTGYSAAGTVIAVGAEVTGFQIGQKVACAGSGIANHAQFLEIPVNLAVPIPEPVEEKWASTVTLGAIALQGVRRAQPSLGETMVVIGLGIIGQLTTQLLKAAGCKVIAFDLSAERVAIAKQQGILAFTTQEQSAQVIVENLTAHFGADAVLITAASSEHTIIREAMQLCRKKGRVVIVGDVGLHLERDAFYQKELDVLMSCSYGPGRYDPVYEQEGQDYPLAYVRWSENRNMIAYLELLAAEKISLAALPAKIYPLADAAFAYEELATADAPMVSIFQYAPASLSSKITLKTIAVPAKNKIKVGLVGAGGFAQGVLLPIIQAHQEAKLQAVVSKTGISAKKVAAQYQCAYASTELEHLLQDPEIDLLLIASTHHLHAKQTLAGLKAGKHVFVEKPLAISWEEVKLLEDFMRQNQNPPCVMTGFNRRFSPIMKRFKEVLAKRLGPFILNYRVNAGTISKEHWIQGKEGGGRNIGEACHFYDLFNFLTGSNPTEVFATGSANDNFVATIKYQDGSVCNLIYTALGDRRVSKETMEIFSDGRVLSLNDYKSYEIFGKKIEKKKYPYAHKGHQEEWDSLLYALKQKSPWPISWQDQLAATKIALMVEDQLQGIATQEAQDNEIDVALEYETCVE